MRFIDTKDVITRLTLIHEVNVEVNHDEMLQRLINTLLWWRERN